VAPLVTSAMTTQATGSTIVIGVGRGDLTAFDPPSAIPTDDKGNSPYVQLGPTHKYTNWPSGTAAYAFTGAAGGPDHTITTATTQDDEITVAAVEILDSSRIEDAQWIQLGSNQTITSKMVTTTGPATLVAFWWGDAAAQVDQTAAANNGFTVIDSVLFSGSLVQCAVAVKQVTAAGSYDVTWTATPVQGAQLYLIAVD
jgi:hypothetical protein